MDSNLDSFSKHTPRLDNTWTIAPAALGHAWQHLDQLLDSTSTPDSTCSTCKGQQLLDSNLHNLQYLHARQHSAAPAALHSYPVALPKDWTTTTLFCTWTARLAAPARNSSCWTATCSTFCTWTATCSTFCTWTATCSTFCTWTTTSLCNTSSSHGQQLMHVQQLPKTSTELSKARTAHPADTHGPADFSSSWFPVRPTYLSFERYVCWMN
jgi:hypothetical protein